MVDGKAAVMASPLDAQSVVHVVVSDDMDNKELPENDRPRPSFAEALSTTDALCHYCANNQGSRLELFDIISHIENAIHVDAIRQTMQTGITAYCR